MKRNKLSIGAAVLAGICLLAAVCIHLRNGKAALVKQVQPIEADRVVVLHEKEDGSRDAEVAVTDAETVSELLTLYNSLKVREMSRPMAADRLILIFYREDEPLAEWRVAVCEDGTVMTSCEQFGLGNHVIESEFDYDGLIGLLAAAKQSA